MRRDASSFVLCKGWVLLVGFVGCSWVIAFYWKYVGFSFRCCVLTCGSLLVRVLAPDRGYHIYLFGMGSAPFGHCGGDSIMPPYASVEAVIFHAAINSELRPFLVIIGGKK